jgi:hypothetical protein
MSDQENADQPVPDGGDPARAERRRRSSPGPLIELRAKAGQTIEVTYSSGGHSTTTTITPVVQSRGAGLVRCRREDVGLGQVDVDETGLAVLVQG